MLSGFMAVFNNKTGEFRRRANMTKPSIIENFINEPIPEDKAVVPCAAVRKSTAVPRIIKVASQVNPTISRSFSLRTRHVKVTRDRF